MVSSQNLNDLIQFNVQHLVELRFADSIPKYNMKVSEA